MSRRRANSAAERFARSQGTSQQEVEGVLHAEHAKRTHAERAHRAELRTLAQARKRSSDWALSGEPIEATGRATEGFTVEIQPHLTGDGLEAYKQAHKAASEGYPVMTKEAQQKGAKEAPRRSVELYPGPPSIQERRKPYLASMGLLEKGPEGVAIDVSLGAPETIDLTPQINKGMSVFELPAHFVSSSLVVHHNGLRITPKVTGHKFVLATVAWPGDTLHATFTPLKTSEPVAFGSVVAPVEPLAPTEPPEPSDLQILASQKQEESDW